VEILVGRPQMSRRERRPGHFPEVGDGRHAPRSGRADGYGLRSATMRRNFSLCHSGRYSTDSKRRMGKLWGQPRFDELRTSSIDAVLRLECELTPPPPPSRAQMLSGLFLAPQTPRCALAMASEGKFRFKAKALGVHEAAHLPNNLPIGNITSHGSRCDQKFPDQ